MKSLRHQIDEDKSQLLNDIYEKYKKLMYFVAYDILRDPFLAEDAVQTAFFRLSITNFKLSAISCNKIKSFIVIVTRNVAINILRSQKKWNDYEESESEIMTVPDEQMAPLEFMISDEGIADIKKALLSLDKKYADVIFMRYFADRSNSEIASLFDVSEQSVRVRLYRAKRLLMETMSKEKENHE